VSYYVADTAIVQVHIHGEYFELSFLQSLVLEECVSTSEGCE